ncbi:MULTISPECIES: pyridoxal-phosphate dependent enzyme [unclassified Agarivorans]|uniref:pyridoxal-phosphate dependent enzyme n=1 Tax=unclassified Agarivorans TaxID=2636026 RepID=UPI0010DD0D1C|nr:MULTISPECIES: pyridoxal-phosphate dependent enzyme [unclassified Agarivorans]MDO6684589.1 pyridoxal-phosphate dependent enzyme [Agarivorans sp. 3_MG-2023]MDO6714754.1 pyridoxal-phosphate dependent enzyme [Agarivorans sp. 2_MG-2023]MDO6762853.1 pyridoxal-phosphate dependent enzyme [Agarivorans sp. 1_MG-2023]GDY24698.1 1-aminocyclopropane-1-carboxylate deaminase [Agarivorans sp. Toyoura001]
MFKPSPVQAVTFNQHSVFVKRDDLLHPQFSGNKARKFYHFLKHPQEGISTLVGSGSAQANSLYSLAALAQLNDWKCEFYVDHIPSWLQQNPCGNYQAAIDLGARIIEVSALQGQQQANLDDFMQRIVRPSLSPQQLLVPEGGRCEYAREGVVMLAEEIEQWQHEQNIGPLNVMLPAGTGTTALFLSEYFSQMNPCIEVFSCACVGDEDYLRLQFTQLNSNTNTHPHILPRPKKYHFGKLYKEHYQTWLTLKQQTQIEFELLYDPIGWQCLDNFLSEQNSSIPTLYIHQGGLLGNQSMLARYRRKYPHIDS